MFYRCRFIPLLVALIALSVGRSALGGLQEDGASWDAWVDALDRAVVDYYGDESQPFVAPPEPVAVNHWHSDEARRCFEGMNFKDPLLAVGQLRARAQQALVLEMADAVSSGEVERARCWRARLMKPRGSSSADGALILQTLPTGTSQRADAVRTLSREAITWQTTRARQLLDEATRSAQQDVPMPGRLKERAAEAVTLADLPPALRRIAGVESNPLASYTGNVQAILSVSRLDWNQVAAGLDPLRQTIEAALPSVLSPEEKSRRERMVMKLVALIPREYAAGVRDGQVTVPLEYREAVTFTAQVRQMVGELAPLWLKDQSGPSRQEAVRQLDEHLASTESLIAAKASAQQIETSLKGAQSVLEGPLGLSLRRSGSTSEIVEEVLLETRSLLNASLAAALSGHWEEAQQLRLEAYTTYDPDLEARLLPRDPQLATDIELLLLDGKDHPGVKVLLDRRVGGAELEAAYTRVNEAMAKAGALLKSGIDPTAAAINAGSIVLREGLEGLLVIVAIFAGLRGEENARRRRLFWVGITASVAATAITWLLSQTIVTTLHSHAETIAAVSGILAIGVLLLITNWLFQQVYWKQWVTTLKSHAQEGESAWQLMTVGFLVGYREGFETVLFLQSLVMDAGGKSVGIGVAVGCAILLVLGIAALRLGLKVPYYKILLATALLIGIVLITFVGGTVRAAQTIGWLPVDRFLPGSLPNWMGAWLGIYNTWQSMMGQMLSIVLVLGTWRLARWRAKRAGKKRREVRPFTPAVSSSPATLAGQQ
jgi:high-affinity iron transporter